jgi:hypothetical protein
VYAVLSRGDSFLEYTLLLCQLLGAVVGIIKVYVVKDIMESV